MAADRRVGAVGDVGAIFAELCIERLAHAMQALEFEAAAVGQFEDGRDRQRVVGSKLRKNLRPQCQQLSRAGDVVQIGHRLAREHRIAIKAALLRALDLGVPIGALDQPHHHFAVQVLRETIDMIDYLAGSLLVGLDRQAKAIPAGERAFRERGCDDVERQFEPIRFLGIDGEIEIVRHRPLRQVDQPRHQFSHHALMAHGLKTRMQRGKFDRDAWTAGQGTTIGGTADRLDGARVGTEIALGIISGARAFAEHVKGIA